MEQTQPPAQEIVGQEGADQQEATGMEQTQPPAQEIVGQEGAEPQASEHACLMQQCPAFKFAIQPNYNGASFSSPCKII
jgi:hypothetical protein